MMDFLTLGVVIGFVLGYPLSAWLNYQHGACDAYYFAREPGHPGGRRAGRIIYRSLNHMYGDIPNPDALNKETRHGDDA